MPLAEVRPHGTSKSEPRPEPDLGATSSLIILTSPSTPEGCILAVWENSFVRSGKHGTFGSPSHAAQASPCCAIVQNYWELIRNTFTQTVKVVVALVVSRTRTGNPRNVSAFLVYEAI